MNYRKAWTGMMILVGIGISSCVTQKRCSQKFPQVTTITTQDSTIIRPELQTDTIIHVVQGDTVTIHDTITRIKIRVVKMAGDTIFVSASCPPDTIKVTTTITKTVGFPVPVKEEKQTPWWWFVIAAVTLMFSAGYLVRSIKPLR